MALTIQALAAAAAGAVSIYLPCCVLRWQADATLPQHMLLSWTTGCSAHLRRRRSSSSSSSAAAAAGCSRTNGSNLASIYGLTLKRRCHKTGSAHLMRPLQGGWSSGNTSVCNRAILTPVPSKQ